MRLIGTATMGHATSRLKFRISTVCQVKFEIFTKKFKCIETIVQKYTNIFDKNTQNITKLVIVQKLHHYTVTRRTNSSYHIIRRVPRIFATRSSRSASRGLATVIGRRCGRSMLIFYSNHLGLLRRHYSSCRWSWHDISWESKSPNWSVREPRSTNCAETQNRCKSAKIFILSIFGFNLIDVSNMFALTSDHLWACGDWGDCPPRTEI